jgi:alkanesulfonate monooxygenase SsuD/methylene tetrahydromethanopterin reductase-like flavin-dependent oxidoreductase (luciferase family)
MKCGVSISFIVDRGDADPCLKTYELCQEAEDAGFDFLSMGHHVFTPNYPTSAPLILLVGIAARTSRIKLESVIYLLPLYHPVAVAEQVAMLDRISNGRVIFGCGVGYRDYEFAGFGADFRRRGTRASESLAAIRSAWESGRFSHFGSEFSISDLPAVPVPLQKPHPPIW